MIYYSISYLMFRLTHTNIIVSLNEAKPVSIWNYLNLEEAYISIVAKLFPSITRFINAKACLTDKSTSMKIIINAIISNFFVFANE